MTTKAKVLELFEKSKGTYFSGEDIAEKLSVSRAAIWKAVKHLQKDGYSIDAVPNKGYCLAPETDIISVQGIEKYLEPVCAELKLETFDCVSSTNALARERAANGAKDGHVIIAGSQTVGRGRMGRSFYSPSDSGIYLSILLRPQHCSGTQAARLTTMAAVAVCEAIESVSDKKAQIKWVNDIFIDGKKVCGILTEAAFGLEDGCVEYAVLGIGINVFIPNSGFPEELKDIAGAVFSKPKSDAKNRLAAEVLNRFMKYYAAQSTNYVEEYRKRSFVIGKQVDVISPNSSRAATAVGIDDECRLIVKYSDEKTEALSSGEISIRVSEE